MIRFVDVGTQINLDDEDYIKEFCFFNTRVDMFVDYGQDCMWETVSEFIEAYEGDELNRYVGLIPRDWPAGDWTILINNLSVELVDEFCVRQRYYKPGSLMNKTTYKWTKLENEKVDALFNFAHTIATHSRSRSFAAHHIDDRLGVRYFMNTDGMFDKSIKELEKDKEKFLKEWDKENPKPRRK
jgi:hypothetical protein